MLTASVDDEPRHVRPGIMPGLIQFLTLSSNFVAVKRGHQQASSPTAGGISQWSGLGMGMEGMTRQ